MAADRSSPDHSVAALTRTPHATGIFVDFDGTLAPIVAEADAARPLPGVGALLVDLARRFAVVAVVSGRPVAYLAEHLPEAVELHGLYGLERRVDGTTDTVATAARWRSVIDREVEAATGALRGVDVEHKGLSMTLHFRRAPDLAPAARHWAAASAARSDLVVRPAKMSLELHPPLAVDKGTVVTARTVALSAACYLGDDVGDLPAFAALDRLRAAGRTAVKVAVRTSESAADLLAQADLEVDGPAGAVAFLRRLTPPPDLGTLWSG